MAARTFNPALGRQRQGDVCEESSQSGLIFCSHSVVGFLAPVFSPVLLFTNLTSAGVCACVHVCVKHFTHEEKLPRRERQLKGAVCVRGPEFAPGKGWRERAD